MSVVCDMDPRAVVGEAVRERRRALGMSQERLSEESGLHQTYLSSLERGQRNISLLNLVKVARALQIPAAELLRGV